jgi:choline monooxygenase
MTVPDSWTKSPLTAAPEEVFRESDVNEPITPGPPPRTATTTDELPRAQFHFLWPNLGINIFPGHPNFSIGPFVPLTPDRTYRFLDYFFGPDVEQAWIDELIAFDNQVGQEDLALVEGVQRGVASGALEQGVLMGRSEQLIGHFQSLTAAALAD